MCTLHCDIIKDLIPSYVDEISSEETKKAVEAHLSQCQECRAYLDAVKSTEISAGEAGQGPLNFMKRVKQYYAHKNALGAALLFLFSLIVLPVIAHLHPNQENALYCIIFSGLAVGTYYLLSDYQVKPKGNWQKLLCGIVSALGILYSTYLIVALSRCILTGNEIFGMELSKSGPYFNAQFISIVVVELATFAICAADSGRRYYTLGFMPTLNLTCCALCMFYREILFHMDSRETIPYAIMQCAGLFLLLTAGTLLAELGIWMLIARAAKKTPGAV